MHGVLFLLEWGSLVPEEPRYNFATIIDAPRLTIWWKRCTKACLKPMLVDPCWPEKSWKSATIGSPWKKTTSSLLGHAMAFFNLGNGCHWTRDSESLQWAWVYLSGHQLLHQVGRSHFQQKCHLGCGGPILEIGHHFPLRQTSKAHYR